ncbi:MAG: riboflavin synthase [Sphingomonadaceae bacterium]
MFTGIITDIGTIRDAESRPGADLAVTIGTRFAMESIALGASIACSGVCLTVVAKGPDWFRVDVSAETRAKTAPDMWQQGRRLNLERALRVGDELGGHIVTGHVDGVGQIVSAEPRDGSLGLVVAAPAGLAGAIAPKGSIAVDGVSLTVNGLADEADGCRFELNIIPHTAAWTTLGAARVGQAVNLEIDILARYLQRMLDTRM